MSIEEIKDYVKCPNTAGFMEISSQKLQEIDSQIKRLKQLKTLFRDMQESLVLCEDIYDGKMETAWRGKEYLLLTPMQLGDVEPEEMKQIIAHIQTAWEYTRFKSSCGSYLSLKKAREGSFEIYDGVFTPIYAPPKKSSLEVKPEGNYLCGYCVGDWSRIPGLYRQMLEYADDHGLELEGNCYEMGLNEFAISSMNEYVTRVEIRIGV